MFVFPHGATVDREGNLWVTDARGENGKGHQVFKFNPQGKVLMTLGKAGVSGSGPDLFDQPTDVLVGPDGDVFVTDSHRNGRNNRVVKFTKDGKFVKEWGKKGSGPGEISEPHTIAMDSRGRIFVGDRENYRIQIFDQVGRFLTEWRQFGRPSGITITSDDTIYVTDSESGPDTGAHELPGIKKGIRIGSAKDGTVTAFIEDMESTVVKLLRVMQDHEVRRVGSTSSIKVDVRIIAATNRDLEQFVKESKFRDDLFYRLNVVRITLPSLKERQEDIPMLAHHFLQKCAAGSTTAVRGFHPDTLDCLNRYRWPGNVRELENAIERAVSLSHGPLLTPDDLPAAIRQATSPAEQKSDVPDTAESVYLTLEEVEKRHLVRVLKETKGNKVKAAKILGIDRRTLYRMAERFGLDLGPDAEGSDKDAG